MRSNAINSIQKQLEKTSHNAYFISNIVEISYLIPFTGSSAYLIIEKDQIIFLTDARYEIQSRDEIKNSNVKIDIIDSYSDALKSLEKYKKILIPPTSSLSIYEELQSLNLSMNIDKIDIITQSRIIKENDEIKLIKEQYDISARAFKKSIENFRFGESERIWAAELAYNIITEGAVGESFDTIVASGHRGALPHGRATDKIIDDAEPVIIDFGSRSTYNSDYTRVVYNGNNSEVLDIIDIVRSALLKAIDSVAVGKNSSDIDKIARDYIDLAGYGKFFNHSLGHGIGLDVHELPYLNKSKNTVLDNNMVFTIEPGIYLPGQFGIRLEETVLIRNNHVELLSSHLDHYIYKI